MEADERHRHRLRLLRSVVTESFRDYMAHAWPVIDPTRAMVPSVAIDGMCAGFQVVAEGRIKRIAISTCPGTSKSIVGAIGFPSWLLLRTRGRARVMVGSYAWDFATRDSRRCRDLVLSDWYQSLVDGDWHLRADASREHDWWTSASGRRLIVSTGGKALGERCTVQLLDDVLSGADIHSAAAKKEAVRWINEVLPSRLEDQSNDPRVIIGQRLAVDDPIAEAIRQGWKYLYLPAVLTENDEPCELRDDAGNLVWRDPRAPGEPIMSLLGVEALARLKLELGSNAYAAQYLQRPADDSASLIKRGWWRFYRPEHVRADAQRPAGCDEATVVIELPSTFERITISVDLTFGSTTGDFAVAQAWGAAGGSRFLLEQWRERAGFEVSYKAIRRLASTYPTAKIVIEKAANGAAVIETLQKAIPGVVAVKPIGKKEARIGAIAPAVESGSCYLPLGAVWLGDFVEELAGATAHDDQADAAAYALSDLGRAGYEQSFGSYSSESA